MIDLTLLYHPEASSPARTPGYLHKGKLCAPLNSAGVGLVYTGEGVQHAAVSTYLYLPADWKDISLLFTKSKSAEICAWSFLLLLTNDDRDLERQVVFLDFPAYRKHLVPGILPLLWANTQSLLLLPTLGNKVGDLTSKISLASFYLAHSLS